MDEISLQSKINPWGQAREKTPRSVYCRYNVLFILTVCVFINEFVKVS